MPTMDGPIPQVDRDDVPLATNDDSEEEDYMSMTIAEPTTSNAPETYTQRRLRLQREAEKRAYTPPKAELLKIQAAEREAALQKSMLDDVEVSKKNKGLAMMAKMGYKRGAALGMDGGRMEPVHIEMKEDRGGVGLDSEKKRKFREQVEGEAKRVKAEEGDYRERVRREREEKRHEAQTEAAMRVAEGMSDERDEEEAPKNGSVERSENGKKRTVSSKPLKKINVLWRGLVRRRDEKERDRRMRYDLHQSLSRLPSYDDPTEDAEDRTALGKDKIQHTLVEDLEEEDPELDEFNALEPGAKLHKLVKFLREEFHYCFWCKYAYPDEKMEGCTGLTENDHD